MKSDDESVILVEDDGFQVISIEHEKITVNSNDRSTQTGRDELTFTQDQYEEYKAKVSRTDTQNSEQLTTTHMHSKQHPNKQKPSIDSASSLSAIS